MGMISDEAIDGLKNDLQAEIERSCCHAGKNHDWNFCFRVVLLIIGNLIVVCSSVASSMIVNDAKEYWSLASAILGARLRRLRPSPSTSSTLKRGSGFGSTGCRPSRWCVTAF